MSKSAGIHFFPTSETLAQPDAFKPTQNSAAEFGCSASSGAEFQTFTQLLAQKIRARSGEPPRATKFNLPENQNAAGEKKMMPRPFNTRKF